jgi:hypothetical protein
MPLPRSPQPKRRPNGTRASRRNVRKSDWVLKKLEERFDRFAEIAEQARLRRQQNQVNYSFNPGAAPKEKAPDLSTGGSSSSED